MYHASKEQLSREEPWGCFADYVEWVLVSCGSSLTVGPADDDTSPTPNPLPSQRPSHCEEQQHKPKSPVHLDRSPWLLHLRSFLPQLQQGPSGIWPHRAPSGRPLLADSPPHGYGYLRLALCCSNSISALWIPASSLGVVAAAPSRLPRSSVSLRYLGSSAAWWAPPPMSPFLPEVDIMSQFHSVWTLFSFLTVSPALIFVVQFR